MPHLEPMAIARRSEAAWTLKRPYYGLWTECWDHVQPGLNPFRTASGHPEGNTSLYPGSAGLPRYQRLYDSTGARSGTKLSNRLPAEIFPAGRDWAELNAGPFFGPGQDSNEKRALLEMVQTKTFQAIHASNFNLAVNMMALDAVVSGTGCMKLGVSADASTLLDFEAVNQSQVAFEAGARGAVWGFHRKMAETLEHIEVMWPDATMPDVDPHDWKDGMPPKHQLLESTTYAPNEGVWHYDVLLRSGPEDARRIYQREYVVCPWIVWRYLQMAGEVQGRSPAMAALPDMRTANKAVKTRLESASIRVAGIFTYRGEDSFNPRTAPFQSGGLIQVGSNRTDDPTLRALDLPGDPQFGEIVLEDTRESIRRTFLDLALPDPAGPVRSPTEIIERQREMQQEMGQPYLRLAEECGRPVLRGVTYLLQEAGHLEELAALQPALPDGNPQPLMLDGQDVAVQFTSPMVTAQRLSDAETIIRWADMSQQAAGPEAYQAAVKTHDIPAVLGEKMGAPPELVWTEQEREARAEDARQAQMQQAQPQQQELPLAA